MESEGETFSLGEGEARFVFETAIDFDHNGAASLEEIIRFLHGIEDGLFKDLLPPTPHPWVEKIYIYAIS